MDHSMIVMVVAEIIVSLILFACVYGIGKYCDRKRLNGKTPDEFIFYYSDVDSNRISQFK